MVMQVEVIEQDGEKFVVLPDSALERCGIGDVAGISVEGGCIVLKQRIVINNHEL